MIMRTKSGNEYEPGVAKGKCLLSAANGGEGRELAQQVVQEAMHQRFFGERFSRFNSVFVRFRKRMIFRGKTEKNSVYSVFIGFYWGGENRTGEGWLPSARFADAPSGGAPGRTADTMAKLPSRARSNTEDYIMDSFGVPVITVTITE